ncbi:MULTISPECIES: YheC/YheD family endospore coat-associated protein [Heyndrickxia]|jgi:glutathione synthase/RimK-type ligase-like ATP-grasp enzyme|uniref:YheC/YheD family endospore coat-associated protein n=1 Tax=Heyndrickxia TaxID=2837504 RepID=UPI0003A1C747|nr:YheC/YheD family protein [Heyndrickxia oleronia]MCI1591276.1 YheC/YheD family protein [Heyndrickxia oleronia]MCI1613687.1 YheC/YheD family protein [Heyndrickxia oleronia]MCI1744817.1 YheC/YheD family protein [Heyndrickxia oleronia]MCI1761550.1 YheC/YheD family protein [Heyndrickxia oleronia]
MNIFFDKKRNAFVHDEEQSPFFWGAQDELLPLSNEKNEFTYKFKLLKTNQRVGPLIGVLTSKTKNGHVAGNKDLYVNLQKKLQSAGGLSFVYTLDDIAENFINGSFYVIEEKKWVQATFPFPNIIYNRITLRSEEKTEQFLKHKLEAMNQQCFFFNPSFIDKFSMYQLFKKNAYLRPLLPETSLIKGQEEFQNFLTLHPKAYIKPTIRSQGNGIFLVKKEGNGSFFYQKAETKKQFASFQDLWDHVESTLQKYPFIAQRDIESAKIENKKYDYRILSHYSNKEYQLTGVGIRTANINQITTHVSKGGSIIPYKQVRKASLEKVFHWILQECGKSLSNEFGDFLEFTIDLGRDDSGKLWIFEVNAKPMSFDETEIEEARIQALVQLFYEKSIFSPEPSI